MVQVLSKPYIMPQPSDVILSSRGGFIFSIVVFASCIVSLHTHLPIYCCTINTIEYHLISIVYDYVK